MIYVKLSTNSHLTEAIYKNSQSILHTMTFDLCHLFLKLSEKKKPEWVFVQLLKPQSAFVTSLLPQSPAVAALEARPTMEGGGGGGGWVDNFGWNWIIVWDWLWSAGRRDSARLSGNAL